MKKNYLIILIGVIGLIIIDQVTKQIFQSILLIQREPFLLSEQIVIIKNFFQFNLSYNDGGAWGILSGNMILFYLITILSFGLFYLLAKETDFTTKRFYSIAVMLLIGGTIGNFIDRLLFQEVIDFLDFVIFGYDFPIFNFADIFLVIGVIMFGIDVVLEDVIYGNNKRQKSGE